MSGQQRHEPDPAERGRREYRETEDIGRRDGRGEVDETEEQARGDADVDGDGTPERSVGTSDFISRDVKTELEKDSLGKRRD